MTSQSHRRPNRLSSLLFLGFVAVASMSIPDAQAEGASTAEAEFARENDAAMAKMMTGMDVKPSGDIDRDFTAMMIPHHQGAIDMAVAELRHGRNEQLRRIAQEIIVDQQQEIAAMRLALGQHLPASAPVPTQSSGPAMSGSPRPIHHQESPK